MFFLLNIIILLQKSIISLSKNFSNKHLLIIIIIFDLLAMKLFPFSRIFKDKFCEKYLANIIFTRISREMLRVPRLDVTYCNVTRRKNSRSYYSRGEARQNKEIEEIPRAMVRVS